LTREIARLRDLVRELMKYRENNDVDDAVTAKIEDAMRECAADIGWFESVLAADATKDGDGDDEAGAEASEADVERLETPGKDGAMRAAVDEASTSGTSTPSTPAEAQAKKPKRSEDGGDEGAAVNRLQAKFEATSPKKSSASTSRAKVTTGMHPDACIFDLPGNGLLSLDELSRGGHAYGEISPESGGAMALEHADIPSGVSIRGVVINDRHVSHRLLEIACAKLPREGLSADANWRLSSEKNAKKSASAPQKSKIATPSSYPRSPRDIPPGCQLDNPALFKRLDSDALFFTFYYGRDRLKLLAANELHASSWRFHKILGTWFARLDRPKIINEKEEFETGSVIYFDNNIVVNPSDSSSSGWCQRSKSDFTSRYADFL
jgi:CCR4-NOT transcription complex subunit 3